VSRWREPNSLHGEDRVDRRDADPILLSIEARLKRTGKSKRLIIENGQVRR
jgi:hypothetical protein